MTSYKVVPQIFSHEVSEGGEESLSKTEARRERESSTLQNFPLLPSFGVLCVWVCRWFLSFSVLPLMEKRDLPLSLVTRLTHERDERRWREGVKVSIFTPSLTILHLFTWGRWFHRSQCLRSLCFPHRTHDEMGSQLTFCEWEDGEGGEELFLSSLLCCQLALFLRKKRDLRLVVNFFPQCQSSSPKSQRTSENEEKQITPSDSRTFFFPFGVSLPQ